MTSPARPLFSVVTPVYEPPLDVLQEMIESIRDQAFPDWELIMVDDRSPSQEVRTLLRAAAAEDPRIRVIERVENGRIVAASNDGVAAARGEFIVFVDHDDLVYPKALELVAEAIDAEPDVDYVYTDEDKVDAEGLHYNDFRKPDWSPERLRGQMYTGHLSVMRASLVREVGAFRDGFDGSQDHDLTLRVGERARRVVHIPKVLYSWRVVPGSAAGDENAKPYAREAGRRAVQEHLERVGIDGQALLGPVPGCYRVVRSGDPAQKVSVIIPTRGDAGMVWGLRRCYVVGAVRSILNKAGHDNYEIVVVYDDSTPPGVLDQLTDLAGDRLVLVRFSEPFNFSAKCNVGFLASTGDVVVFMNDDMEAMSDGFLAQLVAPLAEQDVGMTGAQLFYGDGTVQHAGHAYITGHYAHAFQGLPDDDPGPFGVLRINREVSGLTAACVAIRRDTYQEAGGFCEELPGSFNDVDLSLKLRSLGYRLVWLSEVKLYHFESRTRDNTVHSWEHRLVLRRWGLPERDDYLPDATAAPLG